MINYQAFMFVLFLIFVFQLRINLAADCSQNAQIFDTLTVPALEIYNLTANGLPYCATPQDSTWMFFYFSYFCDKPEGCESDDVPIIINDEKLADWGCGVEPVYLHNGSMPLHFCVSATTADDLQVYWDTESPGGYGLAAISSLFIFLPADVSDQVQYYIVPEPPYEFMLGTNQPTWFTFTLQHPLYILKNFRSENPQPHCEYRMDVLSAPGKGDYAPNRHLLTINESEPFVEQYLENNIYSFFITNGNLGCVPVVLFEKVPFEMGDWFNVTQIFCEGTVTATAEGYLDPSHQISQEYYMWRHFHCDQHPVEFTGEFYLIDGQLTIEFLDEHNETIDHQEFHADPVNPFDAPPQVFTGPPAMGLTLCYIAADQPEHKASVRVQATQATVTTESSLLARSESIGSAFSDSKKCRPITLTSTKSTMSTSQTLPSTKFTETSETSTRALDSAAFKFFPFFLTCLLVFLEMICDLS